MQPRPTATPDPTVQAAAPRHLTYRPDVDGLRALAVSSVIGFHAGIPFLQGGFVGVDVFFVISGYLIGSLIYRDVRQNRFSFADFYSRRARRILPALFATLGLSTVMAVLILTPSELVRFFHQLHCDGSCCFKRGFLAEHELLRTVRRHEPLA